MKSVARTERLIVLEAHGALNPRPAEIEALCNAVVYAVSRGSNVAIYALQHNLYVSRGGTTSLREQLLAIWDKVQKVRGNHGDHLRLYHMERLFPTKPANRGWDVATVEIMPRRPNEKRSEIRAYRTNWDTILHRLPAGAPIPETDPALPHYVHMVRTIQKSRAERKFPAAHSWKTDGALVEFDVNRSP